MMENMPKEPLYWEWVCPLRTVETYKFRGETGFQLAECGVPLHLTGMGNFAVEDVLDRRTPMSASITFAWQLVCENDHTLLTGAYEDEDHAPFDPAWLEEIGAQKVARY